MALPTPIKSWIFKSFTLTSTGTAVTDWKNFWLALVEAMTTPTGWTTQAGGSTTNSYPWTVVASSNGTVANTSDNWTNIIGTNTSASVNTSGGNNVLRIRNSPNATYSSYTVTSGASVDKTTIVTDLNTAFSGAGSTLYASITGTNQLTISDTGYTSNGYIDIDTIANGSTLGTPCGFASGGVTTQGNITYSSSYSWIILGQPQINPNFQVCWALSSSGSAHLMSSYVSHYAGFSTSGLSVSATPTATDRLQCHSGGSANGVGNNAWQAVYHICMSTDGQCTRIFGFVGNYSSSINLMRTFWLFDKPKNPIAGWTNPSICLMQPNTGTLVPTAYTELTDYAEINARAPVTGAMYLFCSTEFYGTAALGEKQYTPNQISGEWPLTPIGLISATPGAMGRHGEIFDLWFTSSYLYAGASFPDASTRDFMCMSYIVHPWNQSALLMD